ncbi:MAG: hypothetical protein H0W67_02400 [Gemmatimonadales bacterium]|nr:hypothetical protein [Gemmatimonadales bacterium]
MLLVFAATPLAAQARNATVPDTADQVEAGRETVLFAVPRGLALAADTAADSMRVALLASGAPARVIRRSGEWVRLQVEGWAREADLRPSEGGALVGVTAAEVRGDPDRYVGKTVEWRVQLIAVQRADELRVEMPPGQPYLLTRGPLPERGFVYVMVGREQAERFRALPSLQELVLRVTVRAAKSRFLDTPVVELASIVSGLTTP